MPRRNVHDATLDDLMLVGSWLCASDRQELAATRDPDDYEALALDAWRSPIRKVATDNARPVFAFGANPTGGGTATVWGFKTEAGWGSVLTVTKYIHRVMVPELRNMGIRRATCVVHPDNVRSQQWLALLGFKPQAILWGIGTRRQDMFLLQRDDADAPEN